MTTAIQKTPLSNFRDLLEKMRPQIMLAATKHLDPDRVLRVMLTTVQQTPALLECTRESVLGSLMLCTQLGLEPDGRNAAMVPYGATCTLVVGYPGMIELALRSGKIKNIEARVVREGDTFDYAYGTAPFITHKPGTEPGEVTHAYAVAYFTSGATQFDVMTRKELDVIKARVRAKKGPWSDEDHADEMRRKSPVRRLFKYLPSSPEISAAIAANDAVELGTPQALPAVDVLPMLDMEPESQAASIEDDLCGPAEPQPTGNVASVDAHLPPAPALESPVAERSAPDAVDTADTPAEAPEASTSPAEPELFKATDSQYQKLYAIYRTLDEPLKAQFRVFAFGRDSMMPAVKKAGSIHTFEQLMQHLEILKGGA